MVRQEGDTTFVPNQERKRRFRPSPLAFSYQVHDLRQRSFRLRKDIAHDVGVTPGAITLWENGSRVPRNEITIGKIAESVNATPEEAMDLLRAAGFGPTPPTDLDAIAQVRNFLENPRYSPKLKSKFSEFIEAAINEFQPNQSESRQENL